MTITATILTDTHTKKDNKKKKNVKLFEKNIFPCYLTFSYSFIEISCVVHTVQFYELTYMH